ncbi:MAG: hypothetical protein O3C27_17880 [Actinomycetota bacterium]|nr:hypothetical protein [Actinomycetota bacterium]
MNLQQWIAADLTSLRQRLGGFVNVVPPELWSQPVDHGGLPPLAIAWHLARHHDVAVNAVVRRTPEVLDDWASRVGITSDTWQGLSEAEDRDTTALLDPVSVGGYLLDVIDHTLAWVTTAAVTTADLPDLDAVPDSAAALAQLGTPTDRFDWLYAMWAGKTNHFFLSWEAIGHGYNHLGELISLRNRLGLSPF